MWMYNLGGRLAFRDITEDDAYLVCKWRNTDLAREMFYNRGAVTPDTHLTFMRSRQPHDLVWVIAARGIGPIGMTSLTIAPKDYTAEYGRAFIDPAYQGQGYGTEQEYMVLSLAFELFNLASLWGDVLVRNEAVRALHAKTGWVDAGIDLPGHTSERGSVLHIEYPRANWPEHRQKFIDKFGVKL